MKFRLVFILSIFLLQTGCTQEELTYTVEEMDGVRYVHNLTPKWGDEPKIELQFVQKFGGLDAEDENYQLHEMREAARDNNGNIYILDAGNYRVQKFDSKGKYVTTIGKKGQGPGEFERPSTMGIIQNKFLYVSDRSNNRIAFFTLDGELQKDVRLDTRPIYSRVLNSGEIVVQYNADISISDAEEDRQRLLAKLDENGQIVKKFGEVIKSEGLFEFYSRNVVFLSTDKNDNIYIATWYDNRVEKYDSNGNLLLAIDRVLNLQPAQKKSENSIWAVNFSRSIGVDGNDRIWVPTYNRERQEGEKSSEFREKIDTMDFEVYDSQGVLLARLPAVQKTHGFNVHGDRIYIGDREDASMTEYRIVEK